MKYRGPDVITGESKLWFGMRAGSTIDEVMQEKPGYLMWCIETIDGFAEHLEEGLADDIEAAAQAAGDAR